MGSRPPPDRGVQAAVAGIPEGTLLYVEVQPGSSRPGRMCYDEWRKRIRISVRARAEAGKANEELVARLAAVFGHPVNAIRVASGRTDRRKTVVISGLKPGEVLGKLAPRLVQDRAPAEERAAEGGLGS